MLATCKSIPATRLHEYGIDLGPYLGTMGNFFHFEEDPGLTQGLGNEKKEGFAS